MIEVAADFKFRKPQSQAEEANQSLVKSIIAREADAKADAEAQGREWNPI